MGAGTKYPLWLYWVPAMAIAIGLVAAVRMNGNRDDLTEHQSTRGMPPSVEMSAPLPAVSVTISELARAYAENEVAAERSYKGRLVRLDGTVHMISGNDGSPSVTLVSDDRQRAIAYMDPRETDNVAQIRRGSRLSLQCVVEGKGVIVGVFLRGCLILQDSAW